MTAMNIFVFRHIISLVFGTFVTAIFADIYEKKNSKKLFGVLFILLAIQAVIICMTGLDFTLKLYPVHTHLILILSLILLFKIRPYDAVIYVLLAYMCCQIPAWISKLITYILPGNVLAECILYLIVVVTTFYNIYKYIGDSVKKMLGESMASDIAFGIIPITYYFFDYITTVWTDLLYTGNYHVTQFMPFVVCFAYIIFIIVLRNEQNQRIEAFKERSLVENQIVIVENEIEGLHELEQMSRIYRHDMRHHFSLILGFIQENKISEAVTYINENIEGIEKITPQRFCDMEVLNLLLSHFATIANEEQIKYRFDVRLPNTIPLSKMEICAMVSNALENAFNEVQDLTGQRTVDMVFCAHNDMLIFSVDNSCDKSFVFDGAIPQSVEDNDHGYGTRSIAAIAKKHNGMASFSARDGVFKMMVTMPLKSGM